MKHLFSLCLLLMIGLIGCTSSKNSYDTFIHIPLKDNAKTADPTNAYDVVSTEVIDQTYEGLYQYKYHTDNVQVIPALAAEMPVISNNGKTYTIKLKKGVRFQDDLCFQNGIGREVTASDFIYAWKRHANPANESQAFWIWDNKVVGINDFQKKFGKKKSDTEVMAESVEGFKELDKHTIQIQLLRPFPQFIYLLALHFVAPIPHEAIEKYQKDFISHPIGTGPFKVERWEPTSKIILVKNQNFREEYFPSKEELGTKYSHLAHHAGKRLPLAEGIVFSIVKEEQPRWLGFLDGKFDVIEIPKDNFSTAIENKTHVKEELQRKGIFLSTEPAYTLWYMSINMKDPILGSNKLLRQAIVSAVDRKGWLRIFKNDRGEIQEDIGTPTLDDLCKKPYRWSFDLDRAKKLLAQAGYPEGKGLPVLHFDTRTTEQSERQLAEFISKNLAKIGVKVEVTANTFPAFLDKSYKGNLQFNKGGWVLDYPDIENVLQLLYGPNKAPGPNESNFDNPEYNKLYEKMALMSPGPERRKVICKMEELIQDEVPWSYGIYETEYRLVNKRLLTYHAAEIVTNKHKYFAVEEDSSESQH